MRSAAPTPTSKATRPQPSTSFWLRGLTSRAWSTASPMTCPRTSTACWGVRSWTLEATGRFEEAVVTGPRPDGGCRPLPRQPVVDPLHRGQDPGTARRSGLLAAPGHRIGRRDGSRRGAVPGAHPSGTRRGALAGGRQRSRRCSVPVGRGDRRHGGPRHSRPAQHLARAVGPRPDRRLRRGAVRPPADRRRRGRCPDLGRAGRAVRRRADAARRSRRGAVARVGDPPGRTGGRGDCANRAPQAARRRSAEGPRGTTPHHPRAPERAHPT